MNIEDAIQQARQVLNEERILPTCSYTTTVPFASEVAFLMTPLGQRGRHPRTILERPPVYPFKSANFDLLSMLLSRINEQERVRFSAELCSRISDSAAYRNKGQDVLHAGSWQHCTSELPLVAEFLVRNGQASMFIAALPKAPVAPGLTLLLFQIEEMIALDFRLFSDREYDNIARAIAALSVPVDQLRERPRTSDTTKSNVVFHVVREIPPVCESIAEMCRKAKYLRLKEVLSDNANAEVNQDKARVRNFLEKLGFTELLIGSLEEAERSYLAASNPFQLKECMAHLRSFLETLHVQAASVVQQRRGGASPTSWGKAVAYLQMEEVITKQEEAFVTSLYTLLSDTGVHPLITEREYARLMRNMNIEYGLLFLTRLEKWTAASQ